MLGALKMTVADAIKVYTDFSKTVFGKPKVQQKMMIDTAGTLKTKYSAKAFEDAIKKVITESHAKGVNDKKEPECGESLHRC